MELAEFREFFKIQDGLVDVPAILASSAARDLEREGFAVVHGAIEESAARAMRSFWVEGAPRPKTLHFDLTYGEANYTHSFFGRYTRHFEFYWNRPSCPVSRDVSLLLHYARNVITGYHPMYGLTFLPGRVGVYLAITHYPMGRGEMAIHVDPNYFLPVHFNVPLTFKGEDYAEGGLRLHKGGRAVDVEALLKPGSFLLHKGSVPHSIERVSGAGSKTSIGRVQMFSIPTEFDQRGKRSLAKNLALEAYGRFKYGLYRLGLGFKKDYKNFR